MTGVTVVKVGGSLLGWPGLPSRLAEYLGRRGDDGIILIAGGGRVADAVREMDRAHGLGPSRAHALALRSLDLTAHLLADLAGGLSVFESAPEASRATRPGRASILAPRVFLEDDDRRGPDPLPHDWATTTDSIAARVADRLGGVDLVLLKSAPAPPSGSRAEAAALGRVDPVFETAARALRRVVYLDLRTPSAGPVLLR